MNVSHPNAIAAGSTGAGAVLLIWLAQQLGVPGVTPEIGAAAAATLSAAVLLIGKRGMRGLIRWLWRGDESRR